MSQSIKVERLAEEIERQLTEYKDLASDELKKAVKKAGRTAKEDINSSAPVKTGKYAKSWKTKVTAENANAIAVTVYSPSRYMIAHLLENGHAKQNGGRAPAKVHIKPVEEEVGRELEKNIRQAIENVKGS